MTTRQKLADRRPNITCRVPWVRANGDSRTVLLVTIGFDEELNAREVFCADFKAGSDSHPLVIDSCILISRLLQHGTRPEDLLQSLCGEPLSLIGQIVAYVISEEATLRASMGEAG